MQRPKRQASEYDNRSESSYSQRSDQVKVTDEEKKGARGQLYSLIFHDPEAIIATIPSIINGAGPIVIFFFFGEILNAVTGYAMQLAMHQNDPVTYPYETIVNPMNTILKYILYMTCVVIILSIAKFFNTCLWIRVGCRLSTTIKRNLFKNMMKSEVTFFDVNPIGGILTLLSEDAQMVQDAFGVTKGNQVQNVSQFVVGIIMAYVYSWKLALVATATMPVMAILVGIFIPMVIKHSSIRFVHLSKSMTIAEETLSSVRTVRGFNREDDECARFADASAKAAAHERAIGYGLCGMITGIMIVMNAMTLGNLYFGATLIDSKDLDIGDLMSTFMFCMFGVMGIMSLQGSLQGEQKAIAAGARILKLSSHVPTINFDGGIEPEKFEGHIEFKNVTFAYPTRPVNVLKNVSFDIPAGQAAALVGHSGSGKSTSVQLLERYYDANDGIVMLDGRDIKEYNPRWLHRQIGLVSQEPTLFALSIKENILYGVQSATQEEIDHAAEVANAKKFIDKLTDGYETMVGEKGAQLSGGQRQRIAIARAVIKNPKILICDEATSALDAGSEKKVQEALDKVMIGRTAVIVAHRLSTIRNANMIYVFDTGVIVEQGTHDELVAKGGVYYKLVSRQLTKKDCVNLKEDENKEEEKKDEESSSSSSSSSSSGKKPAPAEEEKPKEEENPLPPPLPVEEDPVEEKPVEEPKKEEKKEKKSSSSSMSDVSSTDLSSELSKDTSSSLSD